MKYNYIKDYTINNYIKWFNTRITLMYNNFNINKMY